jgi:hypothetical protein
MSTGPFRRLNVSTDGHDPDQLEPGQEWSFGRSLLARTSSKHSVLVEDPRMSEKAIVIGNDDGWPTVRTESNTKMKLEVHVDGRPFTTVEKLHGPVRLASADFDVHLVFEGSRYVVSCRNAYRHGPAAPVVARTAPEQRTTELPWDFDVLREGRQEDKWRVPVVAALAYAATRGGRFDTDRVAIELPSIKRAAMLSSDFSGVPWNNVAFYRAMDAGLRCCGLSTHDQLDGREPLELLVDTVRMAVPHRTIRLVAEYLRLIDNVDEG